MRATKGRSLRFLDEVLRRLPFRVHVVQTDKGAEFQSHFHWRVEALDIRHVYIRPRTPHLNGKVERSHRVDDQEFYQLLDKDGISDDIHLFNEKLREWENYYNYHRPHGALDGQTHTSASWLTESGNVTGVLRTCNWRLAPQAGFVLLRASAKRESANELETAWGADSGVSWLAALDDFRNWLQLGLKARERA